MKIKKSELYFYELLRDFLHKYLIIQRKFSDATVKNYTDSMNQYRQYLRIEKDIPFDKVGFHCCFLQVLFAEKCKIFCRWLQNGFVGGCTYILQVIATAYADRLRPA